VAEVGNRYRFTFKTPLELRIEREMRRHHLERNGALQRGVESAIDARHAAASDLFLHQIATKVLTDETGHCRSRTVPMRARNPPFARLVTVSPSMV
jgi:hypothetical protein